MDVWPLGAEGREQHWSCQTGWGGCIRSSSPSSEVNCRSGTFTQPLTSGVTSGVMIKVRGQQGPLRSGTSPSCPPPSPLPSPCLSTRTLFFPCLSVPHLLSISLSFSLGLRLGLIETSHPLGVEVKKIEKGKQEKINKKDEWRAGGPFKNWVLLSVLVWFTHTRTHTHAQWYYFWQTGKQQ